MTDNTKTNFLSTIIPHQKKQIELRGIEAEIRPYHALLALLSVQGEKLLNGKLDRIASEELTRLATEKELAASTPAEAWSELVKECLSNIKVPSRSEFDALKDKLSAEGIAIAKRESLMDETLERIKEFVIGKKAYSILIANGVDPALRAVSDGIEIPLKKREDCAVSVVDVLIKKLEETRRSFENFQQAAYGIIEPLNADTHDRELAEDFIDNVIVPSINDYASMATDRLGGRMGTWSSICREVQKFFGDKTAEREIKEILNTAMIEACKPRAIAWAKGIEDGSNTTFKNGLFRTACTIGERLHNLWEMQTLELKSYPSPRIGSLYWSKEGVTTSPGEVALEHAIRGFGINVGIAATVATVAWLVPGIGTIFVLIMVPLLVFIKDLASEFFLGKSSLLRDLYNKLSKEMHDAFKPGSSSRIIAADEISRDIPSLPRKKFLEMFAGVLKDQSEAFNRMIETAKQDLDLSMEKRSLIASECREIRENHIIPLRKELEAFKGETIMRLMASASRNQK
jgi:hypothetical protein